jgi:hypothetical protein
MSIITVAQAVADTGIRPTRLRHLLATYPERYPAHTGSRPLNLPQSTADRLAYDDYHGTDPARTDPINAIEAAIDRIGIGY